MEISLIECGSGIRWILLAITLGWVLVCLSNLFDKDKNP